MNSSTAKTMLFVIAAVFAGRLTYAQEVVRVTENDAKKAIVTKVTPEFPSLAHQLRLSGRCQLDVVIGTNGTVEEVKTISGNPVFTGAATTALKKWKFTPFTADGKPVKAITEIAFEFK